MSLNVACLLHMTEPSRSCCLGTLSRLIYESMRIVESNCSSSLNFDAWFML